ncbi:MAG TPA: hypothetical protein VGW38_06290, partial [Chloroflexota bacterium]|nr:hypothetical protein [Chloroflexota bacterium]
MPSGNWSFPCSPRNPAKTREELRLLASLTREWRDQGRRWSPQTGTQLEFGRRLRLMAETPARPLPTTTQRPGLEPLTAGLGASTK